MIGYHSAHHLHNKGHEVWGIDNFNDYYDVELKKDRSKLLEKQGVRIIDADIRSADYKTLLQDVDVVLHLAAYVHPRHSLEYPHLYIDNNITGTQLLIDNCESMGIDRVVYASTSCVMHGQPLPWNEHDRPVHQISPYGWTKRTNECQFAHSNIPHVSGLRFFTVYGPYGRPDMAMFIFTNNIINEQPIIAYNNGNMFRDFTYVGDIVQGIELSINNVGNNNGHEIYNISRGEQVNLMDFIHCIEEKLNKKAIINYRPPHPADVPATWGDTSKLKALGYNPQMSIKEGVDMFIDWYLEYYGVSKIG